MGEWRLGSVTERSGYREVGAQITKCFSTHEKILALCREIIWESRVDA